MKLAKIFDKLVEKLGISQTYERAIQPFLSFRNF